MTLLLRMFFLVAIQCIHGAVIRVPGEFADIRTAVQNSTAGDTILIAAGVYSGTNNTGIDLSSRTLNFRGDGIAVIDLQATNRAFYTLQNATLTFANMTFRNGSANVAVGANQEQSGGALFLYRGAQVTLTDCRFEHGVAPNGWGGAIAVDNPGGITSNLTLINVEFVGCSSSTDGGAIWSNQGAWSFSGGSFTNNSASGNGGAIFVSNADGADIGALLTNFDGTTLSSNSAEGSGGAVYAQDATTITAENSSFEGNSAVTGGGAHRITGSSYLALTNCNVTGNSVRSGQGGCAYLDGSAGISSIGNTFSYNVAVLGGCIYIAGGPANFQGSSVNANNAVRGGGLFATVGSKVVLNGSQIVGNNVTEKGGAIYLDAQVNLVIINSIVKGNQANGNGGAFACADSKITLTRSAVTENTAPTDPIVYCAFQPYLTYCNILGDSPLTGKCAIPTPAGGLSTAALAGIIVGVVMGVILLVFLCVFLIWHFDLKKRVKEGKIWRSIVGDEDILEDEPKKVEMGLQKSETKDKTTEESKEKKAEDNDSSSSSSSDPE